MVNLPLVDIFLAFLFPGVVTFLVTPIVIKIAFALGMVDDPATHKHVKVIHKYPVARGGGMATILAIVFTALLLLPLTKHLVGILLGAVVVVITGLLDDKYDLNPYVRLCLNFVAGGVVVAAGIGIPFISNPLGGVIHLDQPRITWQFLGSTRTIWVLSDLFALFLIAWTMNFVSMSSGVDGQISGVVVIAAITIALLAVKNLNDPSQWPVLILALATAGAYLGFLPWHFYPQKIMPGYSGATLAGFMLSVLSILSTAKVGTLLVVLGVPFVDVSYTLARRILGGKSPFIGDRGHLHHKLLDMGWGKRKIAVFYWIVSALLGIAALYLNSRQKLYTIVTAAIVVGGLLLWANYFTQYSRQRDRISGQKT